MPKIPQFENHDASQDLFVAFEFGDDSMWSLHPDSSGIVSGKSVFTIMCSNIGLDEGQMLQYRPPLATNVSIFDCVDSESFRLRYIGIKYTAGNAAGIIKSMTLIQKRDK